MNSPKSLGTVALFETDDGQFAVDVRLENETVWLSPEQMASLFGRDRSVIRKHIRNIFLEGELEEIATWAKFAQVQNEGERAVSRTIDYYNLDVIISVGYRVKSQRGTQFRIWATGMLKEHLIKGYTVNEMRRAGNSAELETALQLVRKAASSTALTTDQGKGLVDVITRYTRTYLLLQQYDEGFLAEPSGTEAAFVLTYSIAKKQLERLKQDLAKRGEITTLFGREREDALAALLGNLEQSIFGNPAYPTVESKAAHLLYFVIKNHPLLDGNKRTGACLFLYFLDKNHALLRADGMPKLNDIGMAALALLVAESIPNAKETVIRLIMNMLSEPR